MRSNIILVPTDFTVVSECAAKHASVLADTYHAKVVFLHVIAKQNMVDEGKVKLDEFVQNTKKRFSIQEAEGIVRVGNIFEDIGDVALEQSARFVVMGTHGVRGIQYLVGSNALKVITNSEIPFIVVQDKIDDQVAYKNIVVPMDLTNETKQKLGYASEIALKFDATIHVLYPFESDEYLRNHVQRNMIFAKKYLTDHNVRFETKEVDASHFVREVIRYSSAIHADLIAIMNVDDGFNLIATNDARQQMLTNDALIPVLCVNPKETLLGSWK